MSVQAMRVAEPPGLFGGGGGVAQGPGTAIADNKVVRGDTEGIQGSLVIADDSGNILCNAVLIYLGANQSADKSAQLGPTLAQLASTFALRWYDDTDVSVGSADAGIARSAAGTMKVTNGGSGNGNLMVGGAVCRGFTTSAGTPGTTQYPNDKDWGFHRNSGTGDLYLAYNNAGTVIVVLLAEVL